ncbi:MAG: trigger factor [Clostridia bacterium]
MELLKHEKTENSTVTLTVQVSKEEFEAANTKAFAQNSKKLNIDGFRKGKAPRAVIEKMYGKEIFFEEAINICYPEVYDLAMAEAGITPIGQPKTDVSELTEEGLTFTIVAPVYPEMTLKAYKGLEVEKMDAIVADDAAIDAEVAEMAKKLARVETVDREIQVGDTVNFDFEGFVDGVAFPGGKADGFDLQIGSGQFIPGFEEQLVGAKTEQTLDVNVVFPEAYHAEDLAGKPATFKCTINLVKQTITPEIDDEFAKDTSDFDTLAELKADVAEKINTKNQADVARRFEEAALVVLTGNLEGEIPEVMFEQQTDRIVEDFAYRVQMQGISLDDYLKMNDMQMDSFRKLFSIQADQQVKTKLALELVATAEKFEVTEADLDAEFEMMAKTYNMEIDQIKAAVPADALKGDLLMNKAAAFIRENSVAVAKKEAISE